MRQYMYFAIPSVRVLLIVNMLMASRISLSRSIHPLLKANQRTLPLYLSKQQYPKSYPCPLWSSSFSLCLQTLHKSTITNPTSFLSHSSFSCSSTPLSPSLPMEESIESNPLLQDFDFPPFDVVEAKHVRPGIRALLKKLEDDLLELERTPEKVKFLLRLGQSKPLYNAFKAIQECPDWNTLSDARKRIVESQIKEAILNGVSLEDDKRDQFNKIEQELERLSQKFDENVLDATKKFEKLITDKKEIDGLPATALGMAAQAAVSKGHENATAENGPWVITLDAPSFIAVMQHARNRSLREEVYRAYVTRASSGDLDNTSIIDQTLKLRLEKANLLNYKNYAEVSMATKMATVEKAKELLEKLRSASWNAAVQVFEI
ncbi:organellar oligopeptidase a [Quercus suber]|uniref:Organellar oligopeptidase a n=1 Tax=Quercus suber TaxID=58331 RepID=A0AAW0IW76_QUESU